MKTQTETASKLRRYGELALYTPLLAASCLTPFVPRPIQEKIEEKTGVSAEKQSCISAVATTIEAALTLPESAPLAAIYMAVPLSDLRTVAEKRGRSDDYCDWDGRIASLPASIAYDLVDLGRDVVKDIEAHNRMWTRSFRCIGDDGKMGEVSHKTHTPDQMYALAIKKWKVEGQETLKPERKDFGSNSEYKLRKFLRML